MYELPRMEKKDDTLLVKVMTIIVLLTVWMMIIYSCSRTQTLHRRPSYAQNQD